MPKAPAPVSHFHHKTASSLVQPMSGRPVRLPPAAPSVPLASHPRQRSCPPQVMRVSAIQRSSAAVAMPGLGGGGSDEDDSDDEEDRRRIRSLIGKLFGCEFDNVTQQQIETLITNLTKEALAWRKKYPTEEDKHQQAAVAQRRDIEGRLYLLNQAIEMIVPGNQQKPLFKKTKKITWDYLAEE